MPGVHCAGDAAGSTTAGHTCPSHGFCLLNPYRDRFRHCVHCARRTAGRGNEERPSQLAGIRRDRRKSRNLHLFDLALRRRARRRTNLSWELQSRPIRPTVPGRAIRWTALREKQCLPDLRPSSQSPITGAADEGARLTVSGVETGAENAGALIDNRRRFYQRGSRGSPAEVCSDTVSNALTVVIPPPFMAPKEEGEITVSTSGVRRVAGSCRGAGGPDCSDLVGRNERCPGGGMAGDRHRGTGGDCAWQWRRERRLDPASPVESSVDPVQCVRGGFGPHRHPDGHRHRLADQGFDPERVGHHRRNYRNDRLSVAALLLGRLVGHPNRAQPL